MRRVPLTPVLFLGPWLCLTTQAAAQTAAAPATFAPPVRLHAGEKLLGEGRLYPSPVFHDVDGDGVLDVVVGDLIGRITIAPRKPGQKIELGAETKLNDAAGKEIDFHNW
jgi:hypothetical protein